MEEKEEVKDQTGFSKTFIVTIGIILCIALGLVITVRSLRPGPPKTLDEMLNDTINGKSGENNYLYNNYAFVKVGNMWFTRWQNGGNVYTIPLRFAPLELENLSIVGELDKRFDPRNLYITFDSRATSLTYVALAAAELSMNLATALDTKPTAACAYNVTGACATRPIVSCQDNDKAVIFLREANETKVILEGNCMVLQGEGMNLLKSVDRVLYIWYGIMPRAWA